MLSLTMIVKPTKEEAKLLDRALSYVAKYADEICITQAGLHPSKDVSKIIKKYKGKDSFFKWNDNFSDARNFNLKQATQKYFFWIDTDDVVRGAEKIPALLERMEEEKIDVIIMHYLYDFDIYGNVLVQHLKGRIVRRDAVEWEGEIHEDFHELRQLNAFLNEDVQVLHITNDERIKESGERNLRIANKFAKNHPGDARRYWLMGNAYRSLDKKEESIIEYRKFIKESGSDEEKYLVLINVSDIESGLSLKQAIQTANEALNLRPRYPNAYFQLGKYFHKLKKNEQAKDFILIGLTLPIPKTTMIVWNPRDFDAAPLMELTDIYFDMGKIKEAVETIRLIVKMYPKDKDIKGKYEILLAELKEMDLVDDYVKQAEKINDKTELRIFLETLPEKVRIHPKMCYLRNKMFVKEESSGKDLVIYCSYAYRDWNPVVAETKGVGGSEEAVIQLAKRWASAGWNVTVYNNCGIPKVYDGVNYRPFWEYNHRDKQDITILWRHPMPADYKLNSKKVFVDMHDVLPKEEFTQERIENIDMIFFKSQSHRKLYPNVPDEKCTIIPNGIDPDDFKIKHIKNPYAIINTSSPDRSLEGCLDVMDKLIKLRPDIHWKFIWYYGWGVYEEVHKDNPKMMQWKNSIMERFDRLKANGYAEGGHMINHKEVAKKYLESSFFLYPTQFYEISCISAMKAQLAGCIPVTSDFAALDETVQFGHKIHTEGKKWLTESTFAVDNLDKYVECILFYMDNDIDYQDEMKQWVIDNYNWDLIANQWQKYLAM